MTDKKDTKIKEYFVGKGTIEFLPLDSTKLNDISKTANWIKLEQISRFSVECKSEGICPICKLLKE